MLRGNAPEVDLLGTTASLATRTRYLEVFLCVFDKEKREEKRERRVQRPRREADMAFVPSIYSAGPGIQY
jgi:hypothetical protein